MQVEIVQLDEDLGTFVNKGKFDHPYPTTKIIWLPDRTGRHPDLLGTTGDYLRLWEVGDAGTSMKCLLNNVRSSRGVGGAACFVTCYISERDGV